MSKTDIFGFVETGVVGVILICLLVSVYLLHIAIDQVVDRIESLRKDIRRS